MDETRVISRVETEAGQTAPRPSVQPTAEPYQPASYQDNSYQRSPYQGEPYQAVPQAGEYSTYQEQARETSVRPRTSGLRWLVRLLCLGMLVFAAMTVYFLTEQTVDQTSALSSSAGSLAERGAYLVQSGQLPAFEDDPIKWAGSYVLLLSYKFSNHGLSVRQQAHVVEFALLGGIVALNVLAWMSGWAHRRDERGRIHGSRTLLMFLLSVGLCAAASFADQYHKLYVPGRHFDKFDLVLDASGYLGAIVGIFIVWSLGSALYRLVFRK